MKPKISVLLVEDEDREKLDLSGKDWQITKLNFAEVLPSLEKSQSSLVIINSHVTVKQAEKIAKEEVPVFYLTKEIKPSEYPLFFPVSCEEKQLADKIEFILYYNKKLKSKTRKIADLQRLVKKTEKEKDSIRKSLEAKHDNARKEMTVLYQIATELSHVLDYEHAIKLILSYLRKMVIYDISGALLNQEDKNILYIHPPDVTLNLINKLKTTILTATRSLVGSTLETKPFSYQVLRSDYGTNVLDYVPDKEIKSFFNIPLIAGKSIVGMLNVSSFKENAFKPEDIKFLYSIANFVSSFIKRVTEAKKAEQDMLNSLFEGMKEGVVVLDKNYKIITVNKSGQLYLDEFFLRNDQNVVEQVNNEDVKLLLSDILKGTIDRKKLQVSTEKRNFYNLNISPMKDISNNIKNISFVIHDLTEERNKQEKLYQLEKMTSLGEVAAGVAHELNNPLTGVIGYSQFILSDDTCADYIKKDVAKIEREANRCKKIVQSLLTFSRKYRAEKMLTNLNDVFYNLLEFLDYEFKKKDIKVENTLDPSFPLIYADPNGLQQVFFNIIHNAVYAIIETDRKGLITIKKSKFADRVQIEISDNGKGIPRECINKIFDPFFTTKPTGKGTGLGLSLSYGIIEEHGGNIRVKSSEKGTTFIIELPIRTESSNTN